MFDLISIGDTIVDTIIPLIDAQILVKDNRPFLALPFGTKVPVNPSVSQVGGNAANSAVGAARLGLKTAIYTNVGNKDEDEWDNRIIAKFKKEKVDTRYVVETDKFPSDHNIVLDFKGERTILTHHQPWEFKLPDLDYSRWVYLTSMSPSYIRSNVVEQIINYINRSGARLFFQPGTFQIKSGCKKHAKLLVLSEVFICNLEEAKMFLGLAPDDKIPVKILLAKVLELGSKTAIITDGTNGSFGFDGEYCYHIRHFPAQVLEMTGAGDGYATGVLAGLFYGKSLAEVMRWGAANGAAVVEKIGSQAGLLTYHGMQERLKENSKTAAEKI